MYSSWTEQVVLTTSPSLECGFAKELFVRWAPEPRNSIIFTTTSPPASLASRILKLVKNPAGDRTISFSVTQKVFLEGAELALHEVKERKRLRVEAENKAKEMEEAAMEDMMMGIEDYESEEEEEEAAQEGKSRLDLVRLTRCTNLRRCRCCCMCSPASRNVQGWLGADRLCAISDVLRGRAEGGVGRVWRGK